MKKSLVLLFCIIFFPSQIVCSTTRRTSMTIKNNSQVEVNITAKQSSFPSGYGGNGNPGRLGPGGSVYYVYTYQVSQKETSLITRKEALKNYDIKTTINVRPVVSKTRVEGYEINVKDCSFNAKDTDLNKPVLIKQNIKRDKKNKPTELQLICDVQK